MIISLQNFFASMFYLFFEMNISFSSLSILILHPLGIPFSLAVPLCSIWIVCINQHFCDSYI